MNNLHKVYYHDYYDNINFRLEKSNDKFMLKSSGECLDIVRRSKVDNGFRVQDSLEDCCNCRFECEVMYPGLITGVGIMHQAGVTGEFKLGMHFDYTYGYPVVYGSSVKGVLKAYFKECYSGNDVEALTADIFEGLSYADRQTPVSSRAAKPIYERDTFFDAIVVSPAKDGKLIASDALAPHGGSGHDDPFAEPVPIPFIKIAPGVRLRFRFNLVPTKDADGNVVMSAKDKETLFKKMLTTFGIGAKTNVGYGQLRAVKQ